MGTFHKSFCQANDEPLISGLGVFYETKAPTQRIGIVPDVVVNPTIARILAGRDEVLEEALRQIVGGHVTIPEIQKC
jgi:hypothetical protein